MTKLRKAIVELFEDVRPISPDFEGITGLLHLQNIRILVAEADFLAAKGRSMKLEVQFAELSDRVRHKTADIQLRRENLRSDLLSETNEVQSLDRWREGELKLNGQIDKAQNNLDKFRYKLSMSKEELECATTRKLQVERRLIKIKEIIRIGEI